MNSLIVPFRPNMKSCVIRADASAEVSRVPGTPPEGSCRDSVPPRSFPTKRPVASGPSLSHQPPYIHHSSGLGAPAAVAAPASASTGFLRGFSSALAYNAARRVDQMDRGVPV